MRLTAPKRFPAPKVDLVAMQVEGRKDIELNLKSTQRGSRTDAGNDPSSLSYSTEYDLRRPAGDDFS